MLETPHYPQKEVQIHWHGWQGPSWSVPSFHFVICLFLHTTPKPPTSGSLLLMPLGLHTLFALPIMLACSLTYLWSSALECLLTLPPFYPGGDGQVLEPPLHLEKCLTVLVTWYWTRLFPHLPPLLDDEWDLVEGGDGVLLILVSPTLCTASRI